MGERPVVQARYRTACGNRKCEWSTLAYTYSGGDGATLDAQFVYLTSFHQRYMVLLASDDEKLDAMGDACVVGHPRKVWGCAAASTVLLYCGTLCSK